MVTNEQVRRIALFFLFSLMDEKTALHAAGRVIASVKAAYPAGKPQTISNAELIKSCWGQWPQHRKLARTHVGNQAKVPNNVAQSSTLIPSSAWALPERADLGPWMKFHRSAADEEIVAVTLMNILGFSENEIAHGLNVSVGTVRYRVGNAIRKLGANA
jgi:hypothetical protein